jgi:hypothetical protein
MLLAPRASPSQYPNLQLQRRWMLTQLCAIIGCMSGPYNNGIPTREMMEASQRSMRDSDIRRTAAAAQSTTEQLELAVEALNASLEVARNAKADADRSQRLSTGIAVASLAVAVASMAVAIIAVFVAGR